MSWAEQVPWWAWMIVAFLALGTFNTGISVYRASNIFSELQKELALLKAAVDDMKTRIRRD